MTEPRAYKSNTMKYIDTHTHIYAQEFREDIDDVMERALLAVFFSSL